MLGIALSHGGLWLLDATWRLQPSYGYGLIAIKMAADAFSPGPCSATAASQTRPPGTGGLPCQPAARLAPKTLPSSGGAAPPGRLHGRLGAGRGACAGQLSHGYRRDAPPRPGSLCGQSASGAPPGRSCPRRAATADSVGPADTSRWGLPVHRQGALRIAGTLQRLPARLG